MTRDELVTLMSADVLPLTLGDLIERPSWMADALCRAHPEVSFFPRRGEDLQPAKAICAACPVRAECLAYAQQDYCTTGVWGGTSDKERKQLRRHDTPQPSTIHCVECGAARTVSSQGRQASDRCNRCRSRELMRRKRANAA